MRFTAFSTRIFSNTNKSFSTEKMLVPMVITLAVGLCYFRKTTQELFIQKSPANLFGRRFQVIYRMNFLVVNLCLIMDREYLFYYFVALISIWFTAIFLGMALCWYCKTIAVHNRRHCTSVKQPHGTKWYTITVFLLMGLALCINLVHRSQHLFHLIFHTG
ncbi:hypothetical protein FBUS_00936 [Fasciolopsis buskii]|uniref:Cas1p 10 TM acyl transferase domain-containing protein n=1 Tax=Fasciolopsis buskii TaxID=27845 RepID=A0A8E0S2Z6_9TREM|nr:hypothetical protein FBUS_00936 [Fasciolopsis buski]